MKKKNKQLWIAVLIISIIVCAVGVIYTTIYFYQSYENEKNLDQLASSVVATYDVNQADTQEVTVPTNVVKPKKDNPIDFDELAKINSDLYAWIKVPNTQVDYPIAHTSEDDENYYLDRDIYKQYLFAGTIYSQPLNKTDFSDPVTVLYGHNMLNGTMFGDLHKFEDEEFFNKNKYFYVYTKGHILTYEVFAASDFHNKHLLRNYDFSDKKVFNDYVNEVLSEDNYNSNIRKGVKITEKDKLIVLSTCSNYNKNSRYLVQGVLVDDEFTN